MPRTTFGQEFTRLRTARDITNAELAEVLYGVGNNNTSVISNLNQSKLPDTGGPINLERLQKLCDYMQLPYHEKMLLYGLSKHLPVTPAPRPDQVETEFCYVIQELVDHPYPAYVLDRVFFRFWLANSIIVKIIGGEEKVRQIKDCSVFDLVYDDKKWGMNGLLDQNYLETLRKAQVLRFKALNMTKQHEDYYMGYPEVLEKSLGEDAYKSFKDHWEELRTFGLDAHYNRVVFNFGELQIHFRITYETVWSLGDLFYIIRYFPRSVEDTIKYNECMQFIGTPEPSCVEVWKMEGTSHRSIFSAVDASQTPTKPSHRLTRRRQRVR